MRALVVFGLVCAARAAVFVPTPTGPAPILVEVPTAYAGPQEAEDPPLVYLRDLSSEPQTAQNQHLVYRKHLFSEPHALLHPQNVIRPRADFQAQNRPLVYLSDLTSERQAIALPQDQPRYDKFGCNGGGYPGYPPQRQPCPYKKWPCDPYYYYDPYYHSY